MVIILNISNENKKKTMVHNTPNLMKLSLLGDMDEEIDNYSAMASVVAQIGFWIR